MRQRPRVLSDRRGDPESRAGLVDRQPSCVIELRLSGAVQGWERPRFNSKTGAVFTKKGHALGIAEIRRAWEEEGKPRLPDSAVEIDLLVVYDRPKSHFNSKGELNKKGQSMLFPHNKKPDLDNALKLVMDALNSRAYRDDVQVCKAGLLRVWGEWPETVIRLKELGDLPHDSTARLESH